MAYCPECRAEFEHSTKCSWHPNRELHRELATARAEVARLTRERDTTVELVATASRVLDTERAKVSALQEQNDLMRKKLNCMSDCGECHFCLAARLGSANEKIVAYSTANTELRVMIAHGPSAVALAAMKAAHEALTDVRVAFGDEVQYVDPVLLALAPWVNS